MSIHGQNGTGPIRTDIPAQGMAIHIAITRKRGQGEGEEEEEMEKRRKRRRQKRRGGKLEVTDKEERIIGQVNKLAMVGSMSNGQHEGGERNCERDGTEATPGKKKTSSRPDSRG